ncbi:hypothetical protein [Corynebacterium diphtheriae]|uniref:hypothetical protein n=1 Tax=Corynebacterium diphtheriae TaxID=1717 RepID=UPI000AFB390D|nr:hypothetical protein [Corynebacterium diphtheriae]
MAHGHGLNYRLIAAIASGWLAAGTLPRLSIVTPHARSAGLASSWRHFGCAIRDSVAV